ncbi:Cof-type HAD-IIB family hydrolase [Clostridium intestinale]|uniref:Cof-type HAD-IIB family hydrolase n=1 Tax=Clostridium intestinale TaxID=36845 RepID=UPI002DD69989|nr:Cof-type HAD-IIB family hydrolase [Clostridium intestinale]WRY51489.1 Cof-type HAD-IIB family hydrolase [Clostridium intestinale]
MVKLIASDMDGTLINDKHEISKEDAIVIKEAQLKGIDFIITTGRLYQEAFQQVRDAGIDCHYIVMNGAEHRDEDGKILYSIDIDKKQVKEIVDVLNKNNLYTELYTNKGLYTVSSEEVCVQAVVTKIKFFEPEKTVDEILKTAKKHSEFTKLNFIDHINRFLEDEEIKVGKILSFSDDISLLDNMKNLLGKNNNLSVTASFKINMEITHSDAKKDILLEKIAQAKGYSNDEVMVIGDSYNDYTMIKKFKNSFAMGNAIPEIKEIATYVTEDNNSSGVGKAILRVINK